MPEINLTPQLENRFRTRFPNKKLVSLHSHLTDIERLDNWRKAKSGEASIIIGQGLRFLHQCLLLKLIIIDEEHDHVIQTTRWIKISCKRCCNGSCKNINIPIILGTATPLWRAGTMLRG